MCVCVCVCIFNSIWGIILTTDWRFLSKLISVQNIFDVPILVSLTSHRMYMAICDKSAVPYNHLH
jgi:hypothetical protein